MLHVSLQINKNGDQPKMDKAHHEAYDGKMMKRGEKRRCRLWAIRETHKKEAVVG
jgi:hypothetical protein